MAGFGLLAGAPGAALERQLLRHPFLEREVPLILGAHVTTDAGTGAVHTAPGHGLDDYVVGQAYGLEVLNPVDGQGVFVEGTPFVAGQYVFKANAVLVELLRARGALLNDVAYQHSYPHCWRHKTPVVYRAAAQWFVRMDEGEGVCTVAKAPGTLRETALEAIAATHFYPENGRARLRDMIANRPDWCISRQRSWGVPLPFFLHKVTGELHPDTLALMDRAADLVAQAAAVLGKTEDAAHYRTLADEVRAAFARDDVTPAGRLVSDATTAYALALQFALLPGEDQRQYAGKRLAALVSKG